VALDNRDNLVFKCCFTMIRMTGIPTVNVILQRAIWETSREIEEAGYLEVEEGLITQESLEKLGEVKMHEVLETVFTNIIKILTRLIGDELAKKISQEIEGDKNN